jgi:hypothetical protein
MTVDELTDRLPSRRLREQTLQHLFRRSGEVLVDEHVVDQATANR